MAGRRRVLIVNVFLGECRRDGGSPHRVTMRPPARRAAALVALLPLAGCGSEALETTRPPPFSAATIVLPAGVAPAAEPPPPMQPPAVPERLGAGEGVARTLVWTVAAVAAGALGGSGCGPYAAGCSAVLAGAFGAVALVGGSVAFAADYRSEAAVVAAERALRTSLDPAALAACLAATLAERSQGRLAVLPPGGAGAAPVLLVTVPSVRYAQYGTAQSYNPTMHLTIAAGATLRESDGAARPAAEGRWSWQSDGGGYYGWGGDAGRTPRAQADRAIGALADRMLADLGIVEPAARVRPAACHQAA